MPAVKESTTRAADVLGGLDVKLKRKKTSWDWMNLMVVCRRGQAMTLDGDGSEPWHHGHWSSSSWTQTTTTTSPSSTKVRQYDMLPNAHSNFLHIN